jgi:site-specific recombinase XerD
MPGFKPRTRAKKGETLDTPLGGELARYEDEGLFISSISEKTAYRYRGALLQYQKSLQGAPPCLGASVRFLAHLRKSGFKPSTLRIYKAALVGFHKWRGENLVFPIKVPHHLPPYHSNEKVNRILGLAVNNLRDHLILRLQSDAGLRRSEVENLTVRRVDLKEGMLHVLGKGDKDRVIPLTQELHKLLESACRDKKPDDSVVGLKGKGIYGVVKKYARLAGEPGFHPHDLRHAFATRLVEGHANIRAVQELLGHSDLSTTSAYLGLAPKHLEEAIRGLENTTGGKTQVDDTTIKGMQPVSKHHYLLNKDSTALLATVDPVNLFQALKPGNVEEVKLNSLPLIDVRTANKLKVLDNNKKQKLAKS